MQSFRFLVVESATIGDAGLYVFASRRASPPADPLDSNDDSVSPRQASALSSAAHRADAPSKRKGGSKRQGGGHKAEGQRRRKTKVGTPRDLSAQAKAVVTAAAEVLFTEVARVQLLVAAPPSFDATGAQQITVAAGATLRLEAPGATGVPPPQCSWAWSGFTIGGGGSWGGGFVAKHTGSRGALGAVLQIDGVGLEHAGTFVCTCRNALGEARWEEALVTVRPTEPAKIAGK